MACWLTILILHAHGALGNQQGQVAGVGNQIQLQTARSNDGDKTVRSRYNAATTDTKPAEFKPRTKIGAPTQTTGAILAPIYSLILD
jgi:hypothetical protein